jgi:hypothetical protein
MEENNTIVETEKTVIKREYPKAEMNPVFAWPER